MKSLKPIVLQAKMFEPIEDKINKFWDRLFYDPIKKIIEDSLSIILNSISVTREAILSGKIQYNNGNFSGQFNSKISKELIEMGAKFNKKTSNYDINITKLPHTIQLAIGTVKARYENMNNKIMNYLADITDEEINEQLEDLGLDVDYMKATKELDDQAKESLKAVTIPAPFNPGIAENIAKEYSTNMNRYIKNWTEDNILKLREEVYQNTFDGFRVENLVQSIQDNYQVSLNKAKFLARQESNLLTSQYRQERFMDAGVTSYRWKIRGFKTRPDHRKLEKNIYTWDSPPITNRKTGARNHPGQDYGCYCIAVPQVEF